MGQLFKIRLWGQDFTFRTEEDIQKVNKVAEFLVEQVTRVESEAKPRMQTISNLAILIHAALNVSSKYHEILKDHEDLMNRLSHRTSVISKLLEET